MTMSEGNNDNDIVSPETSKRVCTHMNEDHAVSVYAMAKSLVSLPTASSLSDTNLQKVTKSGCHIRAVVCNGEMCEMRQLMYPFDPALESSAELRTRMVQIHHQVCAPKVSWLWTKPICRVIVAVCSAIIYVTLAGKTDELVQGIESNASLYRIVSMVFGSVAFFGKAVEWSAWFSIVVHLAEGLYVMYHAMKSLKLKCASAFLWFILVAAAGFPITHEFLDLLNVHKQSTANKKKE